jgi:hypothetical protein
MSFFEDYLCLNDIIINLSSISYVELFEDELMVRLNNNDGLLLEPGDAVALLVRFKDFEENLTEEFLGLIKNEKEDVRSFLNKLFNK